jgi:hypothetical protein
MTRNGFVETSIGKNSGSCILGWRPRQVVQKNIFVCIITVFTSIYTDTAEGLGAKQ